jgi:DNA repair exonuclease SbcCD nuclease subunit
VKKCLVIGDTHYDTKCEGYLDNQLQSTLRIVKEHKPTHVVFLGDIYHHRKPTPEVIVGVQKMFQELATLPDLKCMYVLRGNHDSQNRNDDGLTALETLCYPGSKVRLVQQTIVDTDLNFLLIPHYEDEEVIKEHLLYATDDQTIAFGHFSYCPKHLGIRGFDSGLKLKDFPCRTILGHIHKYVEDEHVTILGTPWSTNYGEADNEHFVGILEESPRGWKPLIKFKVGFGPRFYEAPFDSLEAMSEEISDSNYFTMLRVSVDKFSDDPPSLLRADIANKFKVANVDIKFQPVYDDTLNERLSGYDPNIPLTVIDADIITKYIQEQASTIPHELLESGLELIKDYADQEANG